jgi:hypothetical protein
MRIILGVVAIVLTCGLSASAAETWTCSYKDFSDDRRTVTERFVEIDGYMVQAKYGTKYRILENNEHGLVAVWSTSWLERGTPNVGSYTIVISKKTGVFLTSETLIGANAIGRVSPGTCQKN